MRSFLFNMFLVVSSISFVSTWTSAQTVETLPISDDTLISAEIMIYEWMPASPLSPSGSNQGEVDASERIKFTEYFYFSEGNFRTLKVERSRLGKWFKYEGSQTFKIYDRIPTPEEPILEPMASCEMPQGAGRVLMILYANNGRCQLLPFEISNSNFSENQMKIVNFGHDRIVARFAGRLYEIERGQDNIVSFPADTRVARLSMAYQKDGEKAWQPFMDENLRVSRGNSLILFIVPSKDEFSAYSFRKLTVPAP